MPVAKVCLYCISSVPSCLLPRYACTVSLLYLHACCQGMLLLHALYSVRYHLRSCVLGLVILTKVKLVSCSVEYTHHSGNVHWIISMVTLFSFAWNHHQKELHSYVARWVFFTLSLVFITVQSNSLLVAALLFYKARCIILLVSLWLWQLTMWGCFRALKRSTSPLFLHRVGSTLMFRAVTTIVLMLNWH